MKILDLCVELAKLFHLKDNRNSSPQHGPAPPSSASPFPASSVPFSPHSSASASLASSSSLSHFSPLLSPQSSTPRFVARETDVRSAQSLQTMTLAPAPAPAGCDLSPPGSYGCNVRRQQEASQALTYPSPPPVSRT
eukprot:758306-Hanusia_phi.AAC.2